MRCFSAISLTILRDADLGIAANLSMIVRELEKKPGVWPVANRDICARSVLWWHRRIEWCPNSGKGGPKGKPKVKAVAQAKGVVEESSSQGASLTGSASEVSANTSSAVTPEALVAEATKLLKGVSLRAIRVESDIDWSWIRSALTSASDPEYCLIDSGATNALRPASDRELESCRVIRVDLASGGTDLRINDFGTLLHRGQCQVILPASYLVELGYVLSWRRRGCRVKHPKRGGS